MRAGAVFAAALLLISTSALTAKADSQLISKTTTISFSESQQQNQSQIINLPNLKSVDKVTVDNGNAAFRVIPA
jgi:P pilus assembly chaperone PapD